MQEINQTENDEKKQKLLNTIEKYFIETIETENIQEITTLARVYIEREIIPPNKIVDALHIAVSTISKLDYLVSWNLANINREQRVLKVNQELNYSHPLRILTPIELIDYGS